jgi:hypothetical protein
MQIGIALLITVVSACCLNAGYLIEHSVASKLPPLTFRRPLHSIRLLVGSGRWLLGFGVEAIGWVLYVVALALAPLSLVQATAAGGIGILAVMAARFTHVPLTRIETIGVCVSVAGLALLGVSLIGGHEEGAVPGWVPVALWLVVSAGAAALSVQVLGRWIGAAPAFGIAAGILFAAGDVSTKMAVGGGPAWHAVFFVALICFYSLGTVVLQAGFQRGSALTTAGLATLLTNALPIAAGMTIFGEPLPSGWVGAVRVLAFAAVITGAVLLSRRKAGTSAAEGAAPVGRAEPEPVTK